MNYYDDLPLFITFSKISSAGNDFIVFDNRDNVLSPDVHKEWFREICQRRLSVGADGVILLQESTVADVQYVHINADGSIATMCGNGSRAVAIFAEKEKIVDKQFSFEICGKIYKANINNDSITTQFITPQQPRFNLGIVTEQHFEEGGFIDTGVPHFVIYVENLNTIDVASCGAHYRNHKAFLHQGQMLILWK